jgi:hypothetical protein
MIATPSLRRLAHVVFVALSVLALVVVFETSALAQSVSPSPWEFLISSGSVTPTGGQERAIESGKLTTVQLLRVLTPAVAVTGTFGWARTRSSEYDGAPKLDLFTFDAGTELRSPRWKGRRLSFNSFAGIGIGGRTYHHRDADVSVASHAGGYVSAGGEVGMSRVRVRLEARDYVTRFRPFAGGGDTSLRNDIAWMIGLRFVRATP